MFGQYNILEHFRNFKAIEGSVMKLLGWIVCTNMSPLTSIKWTDDIIPRDNKARSLTDSISFFFKIFQ